VSGLRIDAQKNASRLVLGTAQMGMPYGIANKIGQPVASGVKALVVMACEYGIEEFDTAQAYGRSEEVLGRTLNEIGISKNAKLITKLDPKLNYQSKEILSRAVSQSLKRLKIPRLSGLMLHKEEHLDLMNQGLGDILSSFVEDGRVENIGISIYTPANALRALDTDGIDIIQVPANLLDHRFVRADVFDAAVRLRKQVYIRSAFLQGLILLDEKSLPPKMHYAKPILGKLERLSNLFNIEKNAMALTYLRDKYKHAKIIFGAETPEQVRQNCICWSKKIPYGLVNAVDETLNVLDERIVDPSQWPK
jgi:aryl-alcohol dehydrogenase-like predicted oxidoreductase